MVRALPNTPWLTADVLERIRPGLALSAALHVGLLLALAYALAFPPAPQPQPVPEDQPLVYRQMPPTVPPKPVKDTPIFHPSDAPSIDVVRPTVETLVIPGHRDFSRDTPNTTTSVEPASPPVIINPHPAYRGGLVFPKRAEDVGMSGYVDFAFVIEPDGAVGDPRVIAETPTGYGFAAAALKAFATWRFEPKRIDGKAVAAPAQIRVSFKLR